MQKQNPIDDLFRSGLTDYRLTPSDERREEFIREASGIRAKRSWTGWWLIAGTILILAGSVAFLLTNRRDDHPVAPKSGTITELTGKTTLSSLPLTLETEAKPQENPSAKAIPLSGKTKAAAPARLAAPSGVIAQNKPSQDQPVTNKEANNESSPGQPVKSEEKNIELKTADKTPPAENPAVDQKTKEPGSNPLVNPPETGEAAKSAKAETQLQVKPGNNEKEAVYKVKSRPPGKWNVSAGVNYTPEWMFNTLNGDKNVSNFGAEGTFHFGRYSIRTGVGLSITKGSNEMLVQTNPYLGSYKSLDSIIFNWDLKHYNLVPTYYTSGKEVFDTVVNYNYSYYQKRYTYLQIPLVLGYDFFQKDWFTLGARAGVEMSLLLKTEVLTATYDPGKDRIITINNVTPDRIQLNWQALAGINAAFRISRLFSIEAEPEVRYYFNSVYEPSDITKKPWSVGFRAAFLVTF
jgi:hypothetical protein